MATAFRNFGSAFSGGFPMSPKAASPFSPLQRSYSVSLSRACRAFNELNLQNGLIDLINFWLASFTWCTTMEQPARGYLALLPHSPEVRSPISSSAFYSFLLLFPPLVALSFSMGQIECKNAVWCVGWGGLQGLLLRRGMVYGRLRKHGDSVPFLAIVT